MTCPENKMKKLGTILCVIVLTAMSAAVSAENAKVIYTSGTVSAKPGAVITAGSTITTEKGSFALNFGACAEVRCGAGSSIAVDKIVKGNTGTEAFFTLKSGECFVRAVKSPENCAVVISAPFASMKTSNGAFYANCREKTVEVYDGIVEAGLKDKMRVLKAGLAMKKGAVARITGKAGAWEKWNFDRDKDDIYVNFNGDIDNFEAVRKELDAGLAGGYIAGKIIFFGNPEPEDISVKTTFRIKGVTVTANGTVTQGADSVLGVIDLNEKADAGNKPSESAAFIRIVNNVSSSVLEILEQAESKALKSGRIVDVIIDGGDDPVYEKIKNSISLLPGFLGIKEKKYYNNKMVFEVMYMGTGYDIAEALIGMAKKTHINIWKYSKNVVKLNVLKVER
jgi:hypothetical protein